MIELFKAFRDEWNQGKGAERRLTSVLVIGVVVGASFILFLYSTFIIPAKDAQIALLQEKLLRAAPSDDKQSTAPAVTKQEVRPFVETINPRILDAIDAGQKDIRVLIAIPTQMRLAEMAKKSSFETFLAFDRSGDVSIASDEPIGVIKEVGSANYLDGYVLHPRDALRK